MKSAFTRSLFPSSVLLLSVALLGGCGEPPGDPSMDDAGFEGSDASGIDDAYTPLDLDAFTPGVDAAAPDAGASDEPDAYVGIDAAVDTCSADTTYDCGTSTCTLQQLCVRDHGDDTCWDLPEDDRCTPCSTQYGSIPSAGRCAGGFPEYSGDSSVGCIVSCF